MESHKNKVLRVANVIYSLTAGTLVKVKHSEGDVCTFICDNYDDNYDLYSMTDKHASWGMSCDTLDNLKDSLMIDFLEGLLIDIEVINNYL